MFFNVFAIFDYMLTIHGIVEFFDAYIFLTLYPFDARMVTSCRSYPKLLKKLYSYKLIDQVSAH
jgi:hypothetical protein